MKVMVFVEGPSDKHAMEALLEPLLEQKRQDGISIDFYETPEGDRKRSVLEKVPRKAVNIILNDPQAIVVAMPDLYPKNHGFRHETVDELEHGIRQNFRRAVSEKGAGEDERLQRRFRVFCLKHDLEALVLASEGGLANRLGARSLGVTWRLPVEDQDHNDPPKRIVERLFQQYGQHYQETVDAPMILRTSKYQDIADRCPQCFKPFMEFLSGLQVVGS